MKTSEDDPDFYLASVESHGFEIPRRAWRIKRMRSEHRDDLLVIQVDPPLDSWKLGLEQRNLTVLVVATRHEGDSLFPINRWPADVHIAEPLVSNLELREMLLPSEIRSIAWGELYRTEQAAVEKRP
jgi:hypothetical protein